MGITPNATPQVLQALDRTKTWVPIGQIDPTTHIFTPVGGGGGTLTAGTTPTSGFTAGQYLTSNGTVLQAANPPASSITANTTPTTGFAAGHFMMSDGTKAQDAPITANTSTDLAFLPAANGGWYGGALDGTGFYLSIGEISVFSGYAQTTYADTAITRDNPRILAVRLRNSPTSPNAFRVYNAYTDASNGEWGALDCDDAERFDDRGRRRTALEQREALSGCPGRTTEWTTAGTFLPLWFSTQASAQRQPVRLSARTVGRGGTSTLRFIMREQRQALIALPAAQ